MQIRANIKAVNHWFLMLFIVLIFLYFIGYVLALGTEGEKRASLLFLLSPFDYSYPIDTRWRINFVRHFYEYKKTKNCITKKRASGFRTCNVMIRKPLN